MWFSLCWKTTLVEYGKSVGQHPMLIYTWCYPFFCISWFPCDDWRPFRDETMKQVIYIIPWSVLKKRCQATRACNIYQRVCKSPTFDFVPRHQIHQQVLAQDSSAMQASLRVCVCGFCPGGPKSRQRAVGQALVPVLGWRQATAPFFPWPLIAMSLRLHHYPTGGCQVAGRGASQVSRTSGRPGLKARSDDALPCPLDPAVWADGDTESMMGIPVSQAGDQMNIQRR